MTSASQAPARASMSLTRAIAGRFRFDLRASDNGEAPKGPFGLSTLYQPPENGPAAADLVFVHGLNGGSSSTWTKGDGSTHFWPKQWLPSDETFHDVRIHTFGYSSGSGKDFSRALLSAIHDAPTIPHEERVSRPHSALQTLTDRRTAVRLGIRANHRNPQGPLVLVGHSMGGLVIRRHILSPVRHWNLVPFPNESPLSSSSPPLIRGRTWLRHFTVFFLLRVPALF